MLAGSPEPTVANGTKILRFVFDEQNKLAASQIEDVR
jgi:hypothetical protein